MPVGSGAEGMYIHLYSITNSPLPGKLWEMWSGHEIRAWIASQLSKRHEISCCNPRISKIFKKKTDAHLKAQCLPDMLGKQLNIE